MVRNMSPNRLSLSKGIIFIYNMKPDKGWFSLQPVINLFIFPSRQTENLITNNRVGDKGGECEKARSISLSDYLELQIYFNFLPFKGYLSIAKLQLGGCFTL